MWSGKYFIYLSIKINWIFISRHHYVYTQNVLMHINLTNKALNQLLVCIWDWMYRRQSVYNRQSSDLKTFTLSSAFLWLTPSSLKSLSLPQSESILFPFYSFLFDLSLSFSSHGKPTLSCRVILSLFYPLSSCLSLSDIVCHVIATRCARR